MKIEWDIEGAGCQFAQCGLKTRTIEIEDSELTGLDETQLQNLIDDYVSDEFDREVYFVWRIT